MSTFKLTDARLEHPVLGCNCIQLRFDNDTGEHFNFQWPLNHGKTVEEIVIELRTFANKLRRDHKATGQ